MAVEESRVWMLKVLKWPNRFSLWIRPFWPSRPGRDQIDIRMPKWSIFVHVLVENATQHCLFFQDCWNRRTSWSRKKTPVTTRSAISRKFRLRLQPNFSWFCSFEFERRLKLIGFDMKRLRKTFQFSENCGFSVKNWNLAPKVVYPRRLFGNDVIWNSDFIVSQMFILI